MNGLGIGVAIFLALSFLIMLSPVMQAMHDEWKAAKERGEFSRYDERQRTMRRSAALHALAAVVVYLVVWAFLDLFGAFPWTKESFAFAMVAVILAYGVWMGECILRDVAVGWNVKNGATFVNAHVLMLVNAGSFIGRVEHIGVRIVAVAMMVVGLVLGILNLYAVFRDEKREKLAKTEESYEEVDTP